jgi:FMN phosphatase YigB (HAD superfamily)
MDNTLHSLHAAAQAAADAVSLFFGTEYNLHFTPLNRDRPSMPAEFREYFGDEKIAAEAFYLYYKLELLCLREFDGIKEVLQKLKDAGIRLVILSNSDGHSVYPRLSLMGLDNFFDAVKRYKPEIFEEVLSKSVITATFERAADKYLFPIQSTWRHRDGLPHAGQGAYHIEYDYPGNPDYPFVREGISTQNPPIYE